MADAIYRTVAGFVQFDPNEREANGQTVRDFLVQQAGSEGVKIRVTVWPEFAGVEINQGDFVAANGKLTKNTAKGKTYINLSAKSLVVVPAATGDESESGVDGALDDEDDGLTF